MHPKLKIKWTPEIASAAGRSLGMGEAEQMDLVTLFKSCRTETILKTLEDEKVACYFKEVMKEETGQGPEGTKFFKELQRGFIKGFQKKMTERLRPPEMK